MEEKDERLLSFKEVISMTSLSRGEIYRRFKQGRFPRPIRLGKGRVAFVHSEVAEWIRARAESAERV